MLYVLCCLVFCLLFGFFFSDFLIFLISNWTHPKDVDAGCGYYYLLFFFSKRKRRPKHTQKR